MNIRFQKGFCGGVEKIVLKTPQIYLLIAPFFPILEHCSEQSDFANLYLTYLYKIKIFYQNVYIRALFCSIFTAAMYLIII